MLPLHYLHLVVMRASVPRTNTDPFASCTRNKNTLSASLWSGWLCSKCSGGCTTLCNVAVVSSKKRSLTSRGLHDMFRHKQESFAEKPANLYHATCLCTRDTANHGLYGDPSNLAPHAKVRLG